MKLQIDNDFQQKIMAMGFDEEVVLDSEAAVMAWRQAWVDALKPWHSPYKALVDVSRLHVEGDPKIHAALARMKKFLEGFFLKSAACFPVNPAMGHEHLPFPTFATREAAEAGLGVRAGKLLEKNAGSFRDAIQIQNHFNQHVVEVSFAYPVTIAGRAEWDALQSKLTNNLMQWHSAWSLLVDCSQLQMAENANERFAVLERVMKGFFLKKIVGYSGKSPKELYPFPMFRARHNAVAQLESEGAFSGGDAQCKTQ